MEQELLTSISAFSEDFLNSKEVRALKECDKKVNEDKDVLLLNKKKRELEDRLSYEVMTKDPKRQETYNEYMALVQEINSLPVVKEYNKAYLEVKKIKIIFEKEILRKLR